MRVSARTYRFPVLVYLALEMSSWHDMHGFLHKAQDKYHHPGSSGNLLNHIQRYSATSTPPCLEKPMWRVCTSKLNKDIGHYPTVPRHRKPGDHDLRKHPCRNPC